MKKLSLAMLFCFCWSIAFAEALPAPQNGNAVPAAGKEDSAKTAGKSFISVIGQPDFREFPDVAKAVYYQRINASGSKDLALELYGREKLLMRFVQNAEGSFAYSAPFDYAVRGGFFLRLHTTGKNCSSGNVELNPDWSKYPHVFDTPENVRGEVLNTPDFLQCLSRQNGADNTREKKTHTIVTGDCPCVYVCRLEAASPDTPYAECCSLSALCMFEENNPACYTVSDSQSGQTFRISLTLLAKKENVSGQPGALLMDWQIEYQGKVHQVKNVVWNQKDMLLLWAGPDCAVYLDKERKSAVK